MSRANANQGLQGHIKLLYDHRALVEEILQDNGGEMLVASDDGDRIWRVESLRRGGIVQAQRDGIHLRVWLAPGTREFCRIVERRRRLEAIGVDVAEAIHRLDTELDQWRNAADTDAHAVMERQQINAIHVVREVEHAFADQIEHIHGQIEAGAGFSDQPDRQIQAFEYYLKRLVKLIDGGTEFTRTIASPQYGDYPFLLPVISQISLRFQVHGIIMDQLMSRLRDYIARLTHRRRATQRSVLFAQWLRRQTGALAFPVARSQAEQLPVTHRAPARPVAGFPDLNSDAVRAVARPLAEAIVSRQRRNRRARENPAGARPASGPIADTAALADQARAAELAERAQRWNARAWIDDFATHVRQTPIDQVMSAISYWRWARDQAPDSPAPSARAWLNELVLLLETNRQVFGQPARAQFQVSFHTTHAESTPCLIDLDLRAKQHDSRATGALSG